MTDNKNIGIKSQMRKAFLPEQASVLDLACGYGEMYRRVYKKRVVYYFGIDKNKIHDTNCCIIGDNVKFLQSNDIDDFNTFDIDSYGSVWKLLYMVLSKATQEQVTIFITDGLPLSLQIRNRVTKYVSSIEMIPFNMKIPLASHFYIDMFSTMLVQVAQRFSWQIMTAKYIYNTGATVCYWVLELKKIQV